MNQPELSIIIPTKDRGQIFDAALKTAVEATASLNAEIIIINDSKTSNPAIPQEYSNVKIVKNPKAGVASARNLGASLAKAELLLFMDDDFLIPPNALTDLLQKVNQDPYKIYLCNWTYDEDLVKRLSKFQFGRYLIDIGYTSLKGWLGKEWDANQQVFALKDGASYFLPIKRSVFREIGGYDENFPHAGAEDFEFIQRSKKIGLKFYVDTSVNLIHNELDRLEIKSWLKRKSRNGETIRIAADMGYREMVIPYPIAKRITLRMLSPFKGAFLLASAFIPNKKWLDPLYQRMINTVSAIYMFEGYFKQKTK
jgi:glycosyltransferase involved in cell wall biosynthesis